MPAPSLLITLGPTKEYWDPVRYLSNESSGKMGLALIQAALSLGIKKIDAVTGPGVGAMPKQVHRIDIQSAREMQTQVQKLFPHCGIFIAAAAVADFRPKKVSARKIKKSAAHLILPLIKNPDILATAGSKKKQQCVVGFSLESHNGLAQARKKLREKNCDWMVLNSPATFGQETITATVLHSSGSHHTYGTLKKEKFAQILLAKILNL